MTDLWVLLAAAVTLHGALIQYTAVLPHVISLGGQHLSVCPGQLAQAGTWLQGPLHILNFQQKHFELIGEPYTYVSLLSHHHWQLNALCALAIRLKCKICPSADTTLGRLAPVSNRLRLSTQNNIVRPDNAIAELILMHSEVGVHTAVRIKATHDNSVWSESPYFDHLPLLKLRCSLC